MRPLRQTLLGQQPNRAIVVHTSWPNWIIPARLLTSQPIRTSRCRKSPSFVIVCAISMGIVNVAGGITNCQYLWIGFSGVNEAAANDGCDGRCTLPT